MVSSISANRELFNSNRFALWMYDLDITENVALAFIMAVATGIGAQIRIYLPFTPVPLTAQVFFVLASGLMLGKAYGAMSQFIYIILGCAGIPWFAGGHGGLTVLVGVTGGYLVGFVLAATLVGWSAENHTTSNSKGLFFTLLVAIGVIYLIGASWLLFKLETDLWTAMELGVIPFIPLDIIKAILAASVGTRLIPQEPGT